MPRDELKFTGVSFPFWILPQINWIITRFLITKRHQDPNGKIPHGKISRTLNGRGRYTLGEGTILIVFKYNLSKGTFTKSQHSLNIALSWVFSHVKLSHNYLIKSHA